MAKKGIGECTNCGAIGVEITVIDEETMLCEECLEEGDYFECDECGEIWDAESVKMYDLKDGRTLCGYCAENMLEDGEIGEDDIASVMALLDIHDLGDK